MLRVAVVDRHPEIYLDSLSRRFTAAVDFKTFDPQRDCRSELTG
jgi:hypothetical protein